LCPPLSWLTRPYHWRHAPTCRSMVSTTSSLMSAAMPRHIPYRAPSPRVNCWPERSTVSGPNVAAIKPKIEAGLLEAPAGWPRDQVSSLPNVATAREQSLNDFEASNCGVVLAVGDARTGRGTAECRCTSALADPALQAKLLGLDAESVSNERNTRSAWRSSSPPNTIRGEASNSSRRQHSVDRRLPNALGGLH
jgi:hypothetical protein